MIEVKDWPGYKFEAEYIFFNGQETYTITQPDGTQEVYLGHEVKIL